MNLAIRLGELAQRYGSKRAVSDFSRGEVCTLTFQELMDRALELKDAIDILTRPGDRVALLLPTGALSVVALWAIAMARRVYVPIGIDLPAEHGRRILDDVRPHLVIAHTTGGMPATHREVLTDLGYRRKNQALTRDDIGLFQLSAKTVIDESPAAAAALVLTSGSTGLPKGILHSWQSLTAAIAAFQEQFSVGPGTRVFTTIAHHFDAAIFDVFSFLMNGAELVIPHPEIFTSPRELAAFLERERIGVMHGVPTTYRLLLNYGKPERFSFENMRSLISGGEVLSLVTARHLCEVFSHATVHNMYGPAEIFCCSSFSFDHEYFTQPRDEIPIGSSFGRCRLRRSEEGELWVSGDQLMLGYWNHPDLNAEKIRSFDGQRWYATGDWVETAPSGELLYRGRVDRMVKRRGIRIELDDIQKNLELQLGLSEVAVVAKADSFQGCRIIAHIVDVEGQVGDLLRLKERCARLLPPELIPDRFERHDSLPRGRTGKIDYRRLAELSPQ